MLYSFIMYKTISLYSLIGKDKNKCKHLSLMIINFTGDPWEMGDVGSIWLHNPWSSSEMGPCGLQRAGLVQSRFKNLLQRRFGLLRQPKPSSCSEHFPWLPSYPNGISWRFPHQWSWWCWRRQWLAPGRAILWPAGSCRRSGYFCWAEGERDQEWKVGYVLNVWLLCSSHCHRERSFGESPWPSW